MNNKKVLLSIVKAAAIAVGLFSVSSCETTATAERGIAGLRACASSALNKADAILYFGPTGIPIGTLYEKKSSGYDALWRGTQITGEPPQKDIVEAPKYGACAYTGNSKFDLKLAFGASAAELPIGGTLSNDLSRSTVLKVTADAVGWETLYKGAYQQALLNAPQIKADVAVRTAYVTVALVKVQGYSVEYQVNTSDVAAIQAKYTPPSGRFASTEFTGGIDFSWSKDNTITFKIAEETTVAGVMREVSKGVVSSAQTTGDMFGPSEGADKEFARLHSNF